MAEQEPHHHHHHDHHEHHHHHHKMDGASKFKRDSLLAIQRKRLIQKWLFRILCVIAILLFIAVIIVYKID